MVADIETCLTIVVQRKTITAHYTWKTLLSSFGNMSNLAKRKMFCSAGAEEGNANSYICYFDIALHSVMLKKSKIQNGGISR